MTEAVSHSPQRKYPVPGGASCVSSVKETRRGIVLSGLLHLILGIVGWLILNARAAPVESLSAHLYDIEFIPLSTLETVLPKGVATKNSPVTQGKTIEPSATEPVRKPSTRVVSSRAATAEAKPSPRSMTSLAMSSNERTGIPTGESNSLEQARINYQDMVASLLARAKRYPERALRRRMTGDGTIRIEIASDGSLSEFNIIQSTESPILDEELKAMVDRAAPFPAFPPDLRRQSLALVVPITFRLDG